MQIANHCLLFYDANMFSYKIIQVIYKNEDDFFTSIKRRQGFHGYFKKLRCVILKNQK